ncbi:hypothetical protein [Rossellomorea vietnamensis]|uniref:hypothetical protein n=1 Tax=Rossellomorea vietnamensis TaxID=218284 RepID=UPI000557C6E4|nr:hypothetical protein [Rossellomorea vietnamensis]
MAVNVSDVFAFIEQNVLDKSAWEKANNQEIAINQATIHLTRWYPLTDLTADVVAYQSIWEVEGADPALKYQKQGVKYVSDGGERIDYEKRDRVAPDVREILGPPAFEVIEELEEEEEPVELYGGELL